MSNYDPNDPKTAHNASKTHAPYEDKPQVQVVNEQLSDDTPTGYVPHDTHLDLDKAQLESLEGQEGVDKAVAEAHDDAPDGEVIDAHNEAENRVRSDEEFQHNGGEGDTQEARAQQEGEVLS